MNLFLHPCGAQVQEKREDKPQKQARGVWDMRNAFKASRKWLGGAGGRRTGAEDTEHLPGDAMVWGEPPEKGEQAREIGGAPRSGRWRDERQGPSQEPGCGASAGLEANQQQGRELQGLCGGQREAPRVLGEDPHFIHALISQERV